MSENKGSAIKSIFIILLGCIAIVMILLGMLFGFFGFLAAMPAAGIVTPGGSDQENQALIDFMTKTVSKYNASATYLNGKAQNKFIDYYGSDLDYQNEWTIVQSIALTHFLNSGMDYKDSKETRQIIEMIARDISPILNYKSSTKKTVHTYTVEVEKVVYKIDPKTGKLYQEIVTKKEVRQDTSEETIYLLDTVDSIFGQYRYLYEKKTEDVSDGSGGTYSYTSEVVSGIEETGDRNARLTEYLISLGFSEDSIGEYISFILSTNSAYLGGIENEAWLFNEDLDNTAIVQIKDYYKNVPVTKSDCTRENLKTIASGIQGVHYFWGGKYNAYGACKDWGKPKKVTASGNRSTGRVIPYGLDCSGYVDWVYYQITGQLLSSKGGGGGAAAQYYACQPISEAELQIGDLGFYKNPYHNNGKAEHVGIFIGRGADGTAKFIHAGGYSWHDGAHPNGQVITSSLGRGMDDNGKPKVNFKYFGRPPIQFK